MFIFLPDSPVTAKGLSKRERRMAVERLRENQTGVENKNLKPYQILEAFMDYKLYMFFILGLVCKYILDFGPNQGFYLLTFAQVISPTAASQTLELSLLKALGTQPW